MNWDTHYITPLIENSTCVGGEGKAPIPTPRFAGERNWASIYGRPEKLESWMPYNDKGGKVYLLNTKTRQMEWVEPKVTGRTFENGNEEIMHFAANAGFVYFVTGDEKYARFASDILTTYMDGFALMQPPRPIHPDDKMMQIVGPTSFEVIHENLVVQIALAYDFVQPYLVRKGVDTAPIEAGLKRWAQRVTDGGFAGGNWNLNQADMINCAALALEDDSHYSDRHGRQYFVDIVLNAQLPNQTGLTHVIKEGFDLSSGLWPEAAGYGFGAASQIVELSSLLSADPAGAKVLADPFLTHAIETQREIIYPNGLSVGAGDTTSVRIFTNALELLVANARVRGDTASEDELTALLQREIASGNYNRSSRTDLLSLTKYVDKLRPVQNTVSPDRTFWFNGFNLLMQQNTAEDPNHALAAALYGTDGLHSHANGMAIETYGKGFILGADPGRGSSYWNADHLQYYHGPAAHNSVIINGASSYDQGTSPDRRMNLQAIEPASQVNAISPNVSFARGVFHYAKPAGDQERTLAIVCTSPTNGLYYDVFRSNAANTSGEFHDFLYHNMGQAVVISDSSAEDSSSPSNTLMMPPGLQKGYSYFKNERSLHVSGELLAKFKMEVPKAPTVFMSLWMPNDGTADRTAYTVDAPKNNAIREAIAPPLRELPMPTLIVRQKGAAWATPFVTVYQASSDGKAGDIVSVIDAAPSGVSAGGLVATAVQTTSGPLLLLAADTSKRFMVRQASFSGAFAAIFGSFDKITEMYLGTGKTLAYGHAKLEAIGDVVSADARQEDNGWTVSATGPTKVTLPFNSADGTSLTDGEGAPITGVAWSPVDGSPEIHTATFTL